MMTIQLLEQGLNNAIAILIYGSECWLAVSFSLYLARRIAKTSKKSSDAPVQSTAQPPEMATDPPPLKPSGISVSITYAAASTQPQQTLPILEPAPKQKEVLKASSVATPALATPTSKVNSSKAIIPKLTIQKVAPLEPTVSKKTSSEAAVKPKTIQPEVTVKKTLAVHQNNNNTITCEPVNWKHWKVGDLRKASIYKACGVRIRPIGSQRNLPKADLVAQYEQNLKRLTKQTKATIKQSKSA